MKRIGEIECRVHSDDEIIYAERKTVVCDVNHPSFWLDEAEGVYTNWKYEQFEFHNMNPTQVQFSYTVTQKSKPVED